MTLPARAAAIRGDDYQHAIGWYWTCRMLHDPSIDSVTIEHPSGGYFDDVVVRRHQGHDTYIQAKSSNYGNVVVDRAWLLGAATPKGRSPLQHFFATYLALNETGRQFSLELWTNRGFDNANPLLGKLLDQKSDRIDVDKMLQSGGKSDIAAERQAWAEHLGVGPEALGVFLGNVSWKQSGSEIDLRDHAKPLMELAGLRSDDDAVTIGMSVVRGWVTRGAGPRTADHARREIADHKLLALDGTLLLLVNGIDHESTPTPPNLTLDFVRYFRGEDSFSRKLLHDPADWDAVIRPAFDDAARTLATYRVRHVHISGALRHPMWFAAGRAFPQVKRWTISMDQLGTTWNTGVMPEEVEPRFLASEELGQGAGLGFAIGLTGDPTEDVVNWIRRSGAAIDRLIVLGPQAKPSPTSVPAGEWAMGWSRTAREIVRDEVRAVGADRVHVFMRCPGGIAMMVGHQWNVLPTTTVYEFADGHYQPTITFPGA